MNHVSGGPSYRDLTTQEEIGPIFNDRVQGMRSCSLRIANDFGTGMFEIPSGTVISKTHTGAWGACAYDLANGAVSSATDIVVGEEKNAPVSQFRAGDWLFIAGATFPFQIDSVDKATKTLTMKESVSLSDDDTLEVDPSVSVSRLAALGTAGVDVTLQVVGHASYFRVGDVVSIEGVTGTRTVDAINSSTGVITLNSTTGAVLTAGAKIVSQARGKYRIMVKTVLFEYGRGVATSHGIAHYRTAGEAFAKRIRGMSPAKQAILEPLVQFLNIRV